VVFALVKGSGLGSYAGLVRKGLLVNGGGQGMLP